MEKKINNVQFVLLTNAANETAKRKQKSLSAPHRKSFCRYIYMYANFVVIFYFPPLIFGSTTSPLCMCFKEVEDLEDPLEQMWHWFLDDDRHCRPVVLLLQPASHLWQYCTSSSFIRWPYIENYIPTPQYIMCACVILYYI